METDWKQFVRDRRITAPVWYSNDWGLFAWAFRNSAELVYAEYKKTHRDAYWFPAIYLYRQWLELGLKCIWANLHRFDKSVPDVPRTHKLSALWPTIKAWLERERILNAQDTFVQSAERIFETLDGIDPEGTGYRYPPLQVPHPDLINFSLADFESAIDQIETVFFAINNLLNDYEEFRIAMLRGTPPQ